MWNDDELAAKYEARGIPTEWRDITPDEMADGFRLYFKGFKSPGADPDGEAEELIHNPLAALRKAKVNGVPIVGPDETPHISTLVVNHHKTLLRFILYAMVVASTNPSTVGITIAKEEES